MVGLAVGIDDPEVQHLDVGAAHLQADGLEAAFAAADPMESRSTPNSETRWQPSSVQSRPPPPADLVRAPEMMGGGPPGGHRAASGSP